MKHTYLRNPLIRTPERSFPHRVAMVGAGTIGPDIGYYLASEIPGVELVLLDIDQGALDRAVKRIKGYTKKAVVRGKMNEERAAGVLASIEPSLEYGAIEDCDWVIEAATEDLAVKRHIFSEIESMVHPDAIITSNTSSLPASRIFSELEYPERATVTHFFAPAFRNPAVEVIDWEQVDPDVVHYLNWVFASTGKVPLITDDVLCFMLDRVFDNWCNDAALLLEGATASEIDSVAAEWVHAGPFFVLNMANGNPIIVETNTLQMEEGEHYRPAEIFRSVHTWETSRPRVPVEQDAAAKIRDHLLGVLFSQSCDILDRRIGAPEDLELGCRVALGFRHGPLTLMEELGDKEVHHIVDRFVAARPGMPKPQRELGTYQDFRHHVLVDDVDGVRVLTIRRPGAMNALGDDVNGELLDAIVEVEGDDAITGFVITGFGTRAFCAGADIGRFPEVLGDAEASAQYARDCSTLLMHLDGMRKPVVAALNGMALGGGMELAMRCHGIVATPHAMLQLPEVTLGIAPGIGGLVVPFRRWPDAVSTFVEMVRCGTRLRAPNALELGVVDALAEDVGGLIDLAVARVSELADADRFELDAPVVVEFESLDEPASAGRPLSREVVAIIETAVRDAASATSYDEALEIGYAAFGATACTAGAREGVTAFLDKRTPDFTTTG